MKKNVKGFTLVELLAVIAILAIIVVIAYPLITGVIENSRKKTMVISAESVVHAAELAYAEGTTGITACAPAGTGTCNCTTADEDFSVDDSKDAWGNDINVCGVVFASGAVTSVSFGNNTSGNLYLSAVSPADLDPDSDGIFTTAP